MRRSIEPERRVNRRKGEFFGLPADGMLLGPTAAGRIVSDDESHSRIGPWWSGRPARSRWWRRLRAAHGACRSAWAMQAATAPYAMTVADTRGVSAATTDAPTLVQCEPQQEAVLRRSFVAGREVAEVTCVSTRGAYNEAAPVDTRAAYSHPTSSQPRRFAAQTVQPRTVERVVYREPRAAASTRQAVEPRSARGRRPRSSSAAALARAPASAPSPAARRARSSAPRSAAGRRRFTKVGKRGSSIAHDRPQRHTRAVPSAAFACRRFRRQLIGQPRSIVRRVPNLPPLTAQFDVTIKLHHATASVRLCARPRRRAFGAGA